MTADPPRRQGTIRGLLAYLTLFCVVLVGYRTAWQYWELPPLIAILAALLVTASFGAAIGSVFGRPEVGASVAMALYVMATCVLMLVLEPPK